MQELRRRGAALLVSWGTQGTDPAYLAQWARKVARAVSRGNVERLRAEYAARGRDKRLSKADREVNRRRAVALRKYCK
jgi:hypothetical protein